MCQVLLAKGKKMAQSAHTNTGKFINTLLGIQGNISGLEIKGRVRHKNM